jgi:hypothetical protein
MGAVRAVLPRAVRCSPGRRLGQPIRRAGGIDLEVAFVDGSPLGVQCRQCQGFGKPQFDKAIADNEYETDRHIVITSAPASARAPSAARQQTGWEVWDIDDIGVRVRGLPRVDVRGLIEDHLGANQPRAFLGPNGALTLAR